MKKVHHKEEVAVIIPYFNESSRLELEQLDLFCTEIGISVYFVDDGSSDDTTKKLKEYFQNKEKIQFIQFTNNIGKTNAVRRSLLKLNDIGYGYVILQDFDLPVSSADCTRALSIVLSNDVGIVSGARVNLAGSNVKRKKSRHWIGRIIASLLFVMTKSDFYDPQSPCKVYNVSVLRNLLREEFKTRWFGDMELHIRARNQGMKIFVIEFPLTEWRDVAGGKLKKSSAFKVLIDLLKLLSISLFSKN